MLDGIVIVDGIRLACGKFGGTLKDWTAADLGVPVVKSLFSRKNISGEICDELIFGNGWQAGVGANVARQISVRAGLPFHVPSFTINKRCGSGLKSVILATQLIKTGDANVIVAGGAESMSNIPYLLDKARWGYRAGDGFLIDAMNKDGFLCPLANCLMGETAENLADQYNITREEQDLFSFNSQRKAQCALKEGKLQEEILPIEVTVNQKKGLTQTFKIDETPRFGTSLEKLNQLPPVFRKDGTVTAGSSCTRADNASAVLVMSEDRAKELSLKPLAYVRAYATVGVDPKIMGIGSAEAIKQVLKKTNIDIDEIDLIEVNEAFAAQILATQRELGLNMEKVNVNGGAIAFGHPVGSTGCKILVTLLYELKRRKARYGIVSLCIGGGQGVALLVERPY
jgi:acetyl-CoA C-acetyltransferase